MVEQDKYEQLRGYFELRTREGGSEYWGRRDEAPEWVNDFCREAHGTDMLPDDYRYELIVDALDTLAEAGSVEEQADEFADNVDVYSSALQEWVGSHQMRAEYVDEAQREGLVAEDATLDQRLAAGQYLERREIFARVVEAAELYEDELATA